MTVSERLHSPSLGGAISRAPRPMRDRGAVRPVKGDPHERILRLTAHPQGPGSVSGAPHLPAGFTDTFTSRYIDTGGLRQHAVIGGEGPPLRLVHGWPQTWYAWRLVMPALARDFEVIAVDQRGIGLTDKPQDGKQLPEEVVDYYVGLLANPDALRGSFAFYREWDAMMAQNEQRKTRRLTMPVLAIGGAASNGDMVGKAMKALADDMQSAVIPGAGHWFAEEAPEETLVALTAFLAPYRDGR
jgi:pimeloyl-ACP methyl ester carboxylesterase